MAYQRKTLNDFEKGFLCAVAMLIRAEGDSTRVTALLNGIGVRKLVGLHEDDETTLMKTKWWKQIQKDQR